MSKMSNMKNLRDNSLNRPPAFEGELTKQTRFGKTKRYFVLKDALLYYFRSKKEFLKAPLKPRGYYNVEVSEIIIENRGKESFNMIINNNRNGSSHGKNVTLCFNQKETLDNLLNVININKNLSKKSSLQSQDKDSQPPESSEKLEFARPSEETVCQDKEKNPSQEEEMNKDDFQSGIVSEINDFEIPIMIKPTFLNSERFQQGNVFEIKRERQNLNSSQSKHTRKTLSVINETNETVQTSPNVSKTPHKGKNKFQIKQFSTFYDNKTENKALDLSQTNKPLKSGGKLPDICFNENHNNNNKLFYPLKGQRLIQPKGKENPPKNLFSCCIDDSSVISPPFCKTPIINKNQNKQKSENKSKTLEFPYLTVRDINIMITNNTRLSTGKPKSENLQRKLLSKPFESTKNEINPFPKILPEISRDDKLYNKTKRALHFEENCLSKLKNDIIKITNDNHEQGRLDSCLDEIILLTNTSNHFKTFLDEVFTRNYDLKTLFESVQVIEECFKFYQKLLENKSKQLISLAKLTNETLTFSFRRRCVLYSNELLKLQGMYIKYIQDLLFSDDISRLFQAQTTPNQRLAYFFKSLDNPNKESSLEKMIQKKINIQFFSLRIINACLWFLIDCANSRRKFEK